MIHGGLQYPSINKALRRNFYREVIDDLNITRKLVEHLGCVNSVSYNENGTKLVSGSDDTNLNIWDVATGELVIPTVSTGHQGNIFAARFVPYSDDTMLISGGFDEQARLTVLDETGAVAASRCLINNLGYVTTVEYSAEFPFVAFTLHGSGFVAHDLRIQSHKTLLRRTPSSSQLSCCAVCPTQGNVFAMGLSGSVHLYDIRILRRNTSRSTSSSYGLSFLELCAGGGGQNYFLYDTGVSGLSWNSTGTEIAANCLGDDLFLFQTVGTGKADPKKLSTCRTDIGPFHHNSIGHPDPPTPSGARSDDDSESTFSGEQLYTRLRGRRNTRTMFKNVCYFMEDRYICSGDDEGRVCIWDRSTTKMISNKKGDGDVVNSVQPHPLGKPQLVTCGISCTIKVWEPAEADDNISISDGAISDSFDSWIEGPEVEFEEADLDYEDEDDAEDPDLGEFDDFPEDADDIEESATPPSSINTEPK